MKEGYFFLAPGGGGKGLNVNDFLSVLYIFYINIRKPHPSHSPLLLTKTEKTNVHEFRPVGYLINSSMGFLKKSAAPRKETETKKTKKKGSVTKMEISASAVGLLLFTSRRSSRSRRNFSTAEIFV